MKTIAYAWKSDYLEIMFGKKHQRREFKLESRSAQKPVERDIEENKHVRIEPPDRSNYPRLFDNWMIILVFALLVVFLIFLLKWLNAGF